MQRPIRILSYCVVAGSLLGTSGCALAPIAALGVAGNVADIYSAAFTAGTEVFSAGKLESYEFCSFEQGKAAVRSMLNDLRLRQTDLDSDKSDVTYHFKDDSGYSVDIEIHRHSAAVCAFVINVGRFGGSEAYARLLLKSVRARLPLVQGRPATQPTNPTNLNAPRTFERTFQTDNLDR